MSALSTLFEQFIRERRYLKNVTPKTVIWHENAFDALRRTAVSVSTLVIRAGLGELTARRSWMT